MVEIATVGAGLAVAAVGGGAGYFMGRRHWRRRNELKSAQSAQAGSLRPGAVELQGQARPATDLLTSPLTGRDCLAYEFTVEEKRRQRRRETHDHDGDGYREMKTETEWVTVESESRAEPFYVADGSGQAMVDAPAADLKLERAYSVDSDEATASTTGKVLATVTGGSADDGEDLPVTEEWLDDMRSASRERRYHERLILPNESVYVYGEAMAPTQVGAAGGSGLAGAVGGLFGGDASVVDVASDLVSDGPEAYRRASRRGRHRSEEHGPPGGQSLGVPDEDARAEVQATAQRVQELHRRQQNGELTPEERQELQEKTRQMQRQSSEMMGEAMGAVEDAVGPEDDLYANERLVVSGGDAVGEFIVSDRGKGDVVSGYTKGVLKWAGVLVGSVLVGLSLIVMGLGLV